jgi:nicotinamide-nucleotide amidase
LIENSIHDFFIKNDLTLSLAESCTGGGIAFRLVQIPGSSAYFLGSVVSYSREAKEKLLSVKPAILATHGEVSQETAKEMALGARGSFDSDYALAVTGIAGPSGGSLQKPVGTVFVAIASKREAIFSWEHHFEGSRKEIILKSIDCALAHLWKHVNS